VFPPPASHATVSRTTDSRRAARPHLPHSARIARPCRRSRSPRRAQLRPAGAGWPGRTHDRLAWGLILGRSRGGRPDGGAGLGRPSLVP